MGYFLSPAAGWDLEEILSYTLKNWGLPQYKKYRKVVLEGLDAIGFNPLLASSKDRRDVFRGCRSYRVGKHIIVYFDQGDVVEILRILHQSMSLKNHVS